LPTHAESRQRLKVTIRPNATQTPIKESLSPLFPDLAAEYNKAAGIGRLIEELGANRKAKSIDEQWRRPRGFLVADLNSRITSILMRDTQEMEAVPLVDQIEVPETGGPRVKAEALRFVLNQLPLPTELTPWEAVLEFREDLDAKERLQRFQFWMRRKTKDWDRVK